MDSFKSTVVVSPGLSALVSKVTAAQLQERRTAEMVIGADERLVRRKVWATSEKPISPKSLIGSGQKRPDAVPACAAGPGCWRGRRNVRVAQRAARHNRASAVTRAVILKRGIGGRSMLQRQSGG